MKDSKRKFLKTSFYSACGALLFPYKYLFAKPNLPLSNKKEAIFYTKKNKKSVKCNTCPHQCNIGNQMRGKCGTKINDEGILYSISYGNPCTIHADPIEKKPLYHFYPGTRAFSLAVAGCNLRCLNCQNWEISQTTPDKTRNYLLSPKQIVESAIKYKCDSIAYTYSEATTFYEYMIDISTIAKSKGIKNVIVSNGYMAPNAVEYLCNTIDGASINLKSFSDKIYMDLNFGHLAPVLETLKILHKQDKWIEIINLVIPTYTDDMDMVRKMCKWITNNLGKDYPLHFSRFFPQYRLTNLPPTPIEKLTQAKEIAESEGLNYVYIGNVPGFGYDTKCPNCKKTIIERKGYFIKHNNISNNKCKFCKTIIAGRFA